MWGVRPESAGVSLLHNRRSSTPRDRDRLQLPIRIQIARKCARLAGGDCRTPSQSWRVGGSSEASAPGPRLLSSVEDLSNLYACETRSIRSHRVESAIHRVLRPRFISITVSMKTHRESNSSIRLASIGPKSDSDSPTSIWHLEDMSILSDVVRRRVESKRRSMGPRLGALAGSGLLIGVSNWKTTSNINARNNSAQLLLRTYPKS